LNSARPQTYPQVLWVSCHNGDSFEAPQDICHSYMNRFVQVAIDTPLRRVFDYRVPASIDTQDLCAGQRVRVPFGRRRVVGIVTAVTTHSDVPADKLKAITELLDDAPIFDAELYALLTWAADYYRHPVGEVLAAALPTALRAGTQVTETEERWRLTEQGEREWPTLSARAVRLRKLAEALASGADTSSLSAIATTWREGLRELEKRGFAMREHVARKVHVALSVNTAQAGHDLNEEQRTAVEKIVSSVESSSSHQSEGASEFRTWLLHGVTGSGKTEVYLRAIEQVVAAGSQALVLVPEIALTPQLLSRFQARFAAPIAVLHSALNDTERLQAWRAARSGAAPIVIGTRSAVFAPLSKPGLIVVDEEHDASYKQQEGFRYSARDLAIVRAQRLKIPVVLGSATPSLESLARVRRQPADLLTLPQRAGTAQPPQVKLIDLRRHAHGEGIATPVLMSMQTHLKNGGQVLVYLNRRGYAPVLFCNACGWSAACKRCDARMTVHHRENKLACHHCGYECAIPATCASCSAPAKPVGQGTERIEDSLAI
jgi:primosomal protein N' (replication factor Y)